MSNLGSTGQSLFAASLVPPNANQGSSGGSNSSGGSSNSSPLASIGNLPSVGNPDQAFADMTKNEYLDYVNNYRGFENDLIQKAQNDTSLVDTAYTDSGLAMGVNKGINQRNLERYGGSLTGAQQQEQGRAFGRAGSLGTNQAVNDSRLAQKEANQGLMSDLINIGQGVNRAAAGQMSSAAQQHSTRETAYMQQKEAAKQSTMGTIASLGSMAIMAWAI